MESKFQQLDEFVLWDNLGEGYNSKVFLGKNKNDNKLYAVKVIKNFKNIDSNFVKEIEILSEFEHENIIKLHRFKKDGVFTDLNQNQLNIPYTVLDYCQNGEIFDFISIDGGLPENIVRKYFIDLVNGLNYIHNKGYAHRDLKPENILLDELFNLKIIDFGFSKLLQGDDNTYKLKTILGTVNYMAPEILNHQKYDGKKVDIFSTGVILFILFTGKPPFLQASSKCKYYNLILNNNHKKFWAVHQRFMKNNAIIPENFKELINSMIEPNPENRLNLENIMNHSWIFGEISDKNNADQEMLKRKSMIEAENNIKTNVNNDNPIKPNFRNSEFINEHTLDKNLIINENKNLKIVSKKWDNNSISNNKVFDIEINDNDLFIILHYVINKLKGKVLEVSENLIKSEFIINKELEIKLLLEFKIFSQENNSKIKVIRHLGSNLDEWKILTDIKDTLRLLK